MTVRESLYGFTQRIVGFGRNRKPRTSHHPHKHEQRQIPPTHVLLSDDTSQQIDALFAQLPQHVLNARQELSGTHLLSAYVVNVNEAGQIVHRFEVREKGTDTLVATYSITTHENDPTRTFTIKANYESNALSTAFQAYNDESLQIPHGRSSVFLFNGSYNNPPVLTDTPTVSYNNTNEDEQPDMNTTVPVSREMCEPIFQHVLGHINQLIPPRGLGGL